jgi:hypothetical protein
MDFSTLPKSSKKKQVKKKVTKTNVVKYSNDYTTISKLKLNIADGEYYGEYCGYEGRILTGKGSNYIFDTMSGIRGRCKAEFIVKDGIAYVFCEDRLG